jgi:transposase InsO family protein
MPNSIPEKPWAHVSADLIIKLPEAQGYDSILVVCDRFSKQIHAIPTREAILAEGLAKLFRDHVWKLHGLPESIISDQGPQFSAKLMKELNDMLGIKTKLSSAYHPQTDGQTERMNQQIEQYLRMFVDHRQMNWSDWLATAEFAYNNSVQASTK